MSELSVQQQQKLNTYLKNNPKISRDKAIVLLFGNGSTAKESSKGIALEKDKNNEQRSIVLTSGRKIIISNGVTAYQSADGTPLNKKDFELKEGVYNIQKSGRYSVTKNGATKYYAADGTQLRESYFNAKEGKKKNVIFKAQDGKSYDLTKTMTNRLNNVTKDLKKSEDENGFIGKTWSGFKNLTGIGDSSDKVREMQEAEKKLIPLFLENSKNKEKIFQTLTGKSYNQENIVKFLNGEIKLKSEQALQGYKDGQEMAVDVAADVVSGIAAVGIYTAAVAAAPFTGGASIAVGIGAAALSGAAIKSGLKYVDAKTGGRDYTLKNAAHDAATGAFSGVLAPVTGGLGGAIGKTVATKLGVQAVKTIGKEAAEEVLETGVKQTIKTALTNPAGYEYVGGNFLKKGLAYGAEMATDGAVGGAIDNSFRTAIDGGSLSEVVNAAGEGFVGGLIMSPVIGGGFKGTAKLINSPFKVIPSDVPKNVITKKSLNNLYPEMDAEALILMKQNLKNRASGIKNMELQEIKTHNNESYNVYSATQSGSNPGFWAENKVTGELFYMKTGNGRQNITENVSSQIYRAAGIDTPDMQLIGSPAFNSSHLNSDNCWIKSKAVTDLTHILENPKAAYEGFAVDAWLANWDAVCSGNTLLKNGNAVRVDFGGTLNFRAKGGMKKFGNEVHELSTLLDSKINPESALVFKDMTRDDLINSLRRVQDVSNDDIQKIYNSVNAYMDPEIFTTIYNRKNYLSLVLKEAEKTKMKPEQTIQEYVKLLEEKVAKTNKKQLSAVNGETIKRERVMRDMEYQRNTNCSEEDLKTLWGVKNGYCYANQQLADPLMGDCYIKSLDKAMENVRLTEPITLYRGDHFRIDSQINLRYADEFPEFKDKRITYYADFHNDISKAGKVFVESFENQQNVSVPLQPMDELIKKIYQKGKIVEESQFISTTVNPTVAKEFGKGEFDIIYKYNAPEGLKAVSMEHFDKSITGDSDCYLPEVMNSGKVDGSEKEIFVARGFKYKMKNLTREDGRYVIECDILPPDNVSHNIAPKKILSKNEFSDFMTKLGYTESNGTLVPSKKPQANRYSNSLSKNDADKILERLQTPIKYEDFQYMYSVVNACDGKYVDYWKSNPEELILFSGNLKKFSDRTHENLILDSHVMENMINSIQNKPFGATLDAFVTFQNEYGINFLLRDLKNGKVTKDNLASHPLHGKDGERYLKNASKMESHIEKQRTSAPMTLYRGDSPLVLESVKLEDGTNTNFFKKIDSILNMYDETKLEEIMKLDYKEQQRLAHTALKTNDNWKQELSDILDEVSKSPFSVDMPGFMSASVSKKESELFGKSMSGYAKEFRGVLWKLDVPENSKCTCIDVIDPYAIQPEGEFLFQKNSKLKVQQAKLEKIDGYYYIVLNASVAQ